MANICATKNSVVGQKESSETFIKKLSKAMFDIDFRIDTDFNVDR